MPGSLFYQWFANTQIETVHSQLAMATAEQVPDKLSEGHLEWLSEMPAPLPLPGPSLVDTEAFPLLTA